MRDAGQERLHRTASVVLRAGSSRIAPDLLPSSGWRRSWDGHESAVEDLAWWTACPAFSRSQQSLAQLVVTRARGTRWSPPHLIAQRQHKASQTLAIGDMAVGASQHLGLIFDKSTTVLV